MELNYLIMLDYYGARFIKIKLTDEEKQLSKQYDDFEVFMAAELEKKYDFRTRDVCWMTCESVEELSYNI